MSFPGDAEGIGLQGKCQVALFGPQPPLIIRAASAQAMALASVTCPVLGIIMEESENKVFCILKTIKKGRW